MIVNVKLNKMNDKIKIHYIYKVTDPNTKEFYIGVRSCIGPSEDDTKYKGSMKAWKVDKSILVKNIILELPTRAEANQKEVEYITYYKKHFKDKHLCKNAYVHGIGFCKEGTKMSEQSIKKLSEAKKGKNPWNKGKKMSDEHNKKNSEAQKGKKASDETKKKLSEARKGNKNSLGNKHSQETKNKISESLKGNQYCLGYHHSDKTKKKMSDSKKGIKFTNEHKENMKLAWVKRRNNKKEAI